MQSADAMCVSYVFGLLIGWQARAYCSCSGSVVDMFGLMVGWQTSATRGCHGIVGCACAGFGGSLKLYGHFVAWIPIEVL